ncbi:deoxyribodipyrimidine photo-lyase [Mariniplasma anaerobium]|uniref:Deoxyribodipyrimidine photo-lyase n=1 Tax=Mariniplasma anaerobium TaxID=2735436 RepID=A0A7U9TI71_9MOLU|nr:deoxyribodipyrimidine photo-lyase [Mariniplasma anaerobium]BCR36765.1 deoxyribodipyrimidine photo-lyase [Mariniplasma anaerobium]
MNKNRLLHLKDGKTNQNKKYVVYWMQQSQRVHYNHALNHAIKVANLYQLPLVCFFGLDDTYKDANERSYAFMLDGLKEVKEILTKLDITFVLRFGKPQEVVMDVLNDAQALIMDRAYLKIQRAWRKDLFHKLTDNEDLLIDMVDTDLIVPVHIASDKSEYGAYTIRPKIKRLYESFRDFKKLSIIDNKKLVDIISDDDLSNIDDLIQKMDIDHSVPKSSYYHGGYQAASHLFSTFIQEKSDHYPESSDPSTNYTSLMSMYLHFGQISSLELLERLYLALEQGQLKGETFDQYIEQLLIRRELAFNYVFYRQGYDVFETMTENWAYQSMNAHEFDHKDYLYDLETLESYQTHDIYFNAAMKQMVKTGYMHNYMRMYWAKKIIEWSPSFKKAYETTLYLNNKYFIDGRDPNSYAGVAWCFGKHDRAWTERKIFGKLRYMNDKGLERKFNIKQYVQDMDQL